MRPSAWRRALLAVVGGLSVLSVGCVTGAPPSRVPGPGAVVVADAPVRSFEEDQCGPGSLSVVLNSLGDAVSEAELAASLPKAPKGGVLSVDLLLAARRRGYSASLVAGDEGLLRREIQEGRAVILMLRLLNMPGHAGDVYHYVVVDGADPDRGLFRMQFGDGKARWAELDGIASAWKGAGRAMLTVSAPDRPAPMLAALELERAGRLDEAAAEYRRILAGLPRATRAWVNLGNVEVARKRPREAEAAYRQALALSPGDCDALNNLAWLLLEEGSRLEEAEALARAAARQGGSEQALVLDTLARILAARGQCQEADATFAEAMALGGLPAAQRDQLMESRREVAASCLSVPRRPGT